MDLREQSRNEIAGRIAQFWREYQELVKEGAPTLAAGVLRDIEELRRLLVRAGGEA